MLIPSIGRLQTPMIQFDLNIFSAAGQAVQQLPKRFDPAQWAALMLQTGQQGEASAPGM